MKLEAPVFSITGAPAIAEHRSPAAAYGAYAVTVTGLMSTSPEGA